MIVDEDLDTPAARVQVASNLARASGLLGTLREYKGSRELSMTQTKIDEAILWLEKECKKW